MHKHPFWEKKLKTAYYCLAIFIWAGFLFHKSDHPQIAFYSYKYALWLSCSFLFLFGLPFIISRNKRTAENYYLLAVSIITVVFLAEITSHLIIKMRQAAIFSQYSRKIEISLYDAGKDGNLGYVLKKNNSHHALKLFPDGTPIYNVTYTTDKFGRRTVGQKYLPQNRHLILFGCSIAYAEGLNDRETLQYMLGEKMPGVNVYNYAVYAYGPQQMLALLETGRLPAEVESNAGRAVYIYYNSHIDRATGSMRAPWTYDFPYYRMNKDGRLERRGSFVTGRPLITRIYKFFDILKYKSAFLRLVNFSLPIRVSRQDIRLTAEIIKEARRQYERQFRGKFYVLIYPLEKEDERVKKLRSILELSGITVLYYPLEGEEYVINGDYHPNARLNEFLTNSLVRDLSRSGKGSLTTGIKVTAQ